MFKIIFHKVNDASKMLALVCFFCVYTSASPTTAPLAPKTQQFGLYDRGWSPIALQYNYEVIRQVLESSVDQYGPYSLKLLRHKDINIKRALRNSLRGDFILLETTSTPINNEESFWRIKQVRYPLYQELLGLRKLIIRNADTEKLSQINSTEDFLNYQSGLVHYWPDTHVFKHANIPLVESHEYASLFPMLKEKRFDYLPLSLIEIEDSLSKKKAFHSSLSVHNDLFIFYPIPCYINVLDNQLQRIEYGMEKALKEGRLDKLFQKHFSTYIKSIQREKAKTFVMENPNLSRQDNTRMIKRAMSRYFNERSKIIYLQEHYTR